MPSVSSKSPRRTAKQNVEHVHKHMVQLNIFVCLRIHQATAEIRLPRHALLTLLLGLWGQEGDPLRGEGEDCLDLLQESHHRADAVRATVDSLTGFLAWNGARSCLMCSCPNWQTILKKGTSFLPYFLGRNPSCIFWCPSSQKILFMNENPHFINYIKSK